MGVRVGIVGVSGYGGASSCGSAWAIRRSRWSTRAARPRPARGSTGSSRRWPDTRRGKLVIQPFVPEELHGVDVLFASLPTGKSREPLARVPREVKIVDVGGDHRFVEGWTYGLTEPPGHPRRGRPVVPRRGPGLLSGGGAPGAGAARGRRGWWSRRGS